MYGLCLVRKMGSYLSLCRIILKISCKTVNSQQISLVYANQVGCFSTLNTWMLYVVCPLLHVYRFLHFFHGLCAESARAHVCARKAIFGTFCTENMNFHEFSHRFYKCDFLFNKTDHAAWRNFWNLWRIPSLTSSILYIFFGGSK